MIKKVIFPENLQQSQKMFFEETNITKLKNPQIVPLFGPNGVGKTTFLHAVYEALRYKANIEKYKEDEDFKWYKEQFDYDLKRRGCLIDCDNVSYKCPTYFNSEQNFRNIESSFDPFLINSKFDVKNMSEGQSIVYSLFGLFDWLKPGDEMIKEENGEIIVLIDEFDSGLSIDNLDMFLRKMKKIIKQRDDVQIFFSFNNPRVLKFFPEVLSMYDGKPVLLHNTEDMLEEIRKHKKMFNKLRKKSNGMPKVYD